MTEPAPEQELSPEDFRERVRRLVILWAACCMSPIMYLAAAAVIKKAFMPEGGWLPLEPFTWSRVMTGLVVWVILLQVLHVAVKISVNRRQALVPVYSEAFVRLLTRRTFILIGVSEAAVATGFCLFLLQGDYTPVFGAGVAAMLLYGQSHPRLGLKPENL
jgi:hypothetical protein